MGKKKRRRKMRNRRDCKKVYMYIQNAFSHVKVYTVIPYLRSRASWTRSRCCITFPGAVFELGMESVVHNREIGVENQHRMSTGTLETFGSGTSAQGATERRRC